MLFILSLGCSDAWDEHKKVNSDTPSETIMEMLNSNSEYSKFANALVETGLNELLNKTMLFTVWVPSNNSISQLPGDSASLYNWVANHIISGSVKMNEVEESNKRIKMLSGKSLNIDSNNSTIDELSFDKDYEVARNGIFYLVEEPIVPRINIWEYIATVASSNKHVDYLNSLSGEVFNPDSAEIIGYTELGMPIYDTLSGMVWDNSFLYDVADLRSEDSTFTMLIVDDQVFDSEYQKFFKYFKITSGSTENDSLKNSKMCKYKITKDYVFTSIKKLDDISDSLISPDNVKVPVVKSAIYESYRCSNGWVYKISECDIAKSDKILPITVEGEYDFRIYDGFTIAENEKEGDQHGYKRINSDAQGGFDYVVDNWTTNVKGSGLILYAGEVASMRYKFYIRAIHDFNGSFRRSKGSDYELKQRLGWSTLIKETIKGYDFNPPTFVGDTVFVNERSYVSYDSLDVDFENPMPIPPVEVGTYRFTSMKDAYVWLQSVDDGAAVVADYVKLVPDFEE